MALRRRDAWLIAGVAALAVSAGVLLGPAILVRDQGGEPALAAAFADLSGKQRGLDEWRGQIVLLNFWATWCEPCREEIPMLVRARSEYVGYGFEVVGIGIDNASKMSQFVRSAGITYPILVGDTAAMDLMRSLGNKASGLPYTVLVDREGKPRERKLGQLERAELDGWLGRHGIPGKANTR